MKFLSTGMTLDQAKQEEKKISEGMTFKPQCYICKRRLGDKTVLIEEGGKSMIGEILITNIIRKIKTDDEEIDAEFLLCSECRALLGESI